MLGPMADSAQAAEVSAEETSGETEVSALLHAWQLGSSDAPDQLFLLVYEDLRRIAHAQLRREQQGHTLDTGGLVHEAYLKLAEQTRVEFADRAHFYAIASRAMRRILVDYARRFRTEKRGGSTKRAGLHDDALAAETRSDVLLELDDSLSELAKLDERLARVVECRFFGGLTEDETGEVLGISARTVRRDWIKAKGWLNRELR